MRVKLRKLNIYGFKSFAEKTQFVFDKNITGIVGPNGCGKSNIVDAIFWVFQSHSLKTLRANEKQDLIFKGNDVKSPAGFAEVELIFNVYDYQNNDNFSIEDYKEEFSIKKRLYPSGETVYYLNKKEARPKEITELLKSYSITSIDYSIIGQGSVTKLIEMKPEERVELIESAAGIRNIKIERSKAFLELAKTEENLKSISLFSEEIENEVNKLKQQAEKARIYKDSNDNIIFAEQGLQIIKYRKIIESIDKLQKEYEQSNENLMNYEKKTRIIEESKNKVNERIKELEKDIDEKKQNIFKIESDIAVIERTILLSQKRFEELAIEKRRKLEDLNFFKNRIKKIDELLSFPFDELKQEYELELEKKEELEEDIGKLDQKIKEYNYNIDKTSLEIKSLEKKLKSLYSQQEEFLDKEISTLFSNLYVVRMKLINFFSNIKNISDLSSQEKTKLIGIKARIEDLIKFKNSSNDQIVSYIVSIKDELEKLISVLNEIFIKTDGISKESYEFENLLFGKDSIYSKFQESNSSINDVDEKLEQEKNNLSHFQEEFNNLIEARNLMNKRLDETNRRIFQIDEKLKNYQINKTRFENEKVELNYNIKQKDEEISQLEKTMEKIKSEGIELIDEKDKIFSQKKDIDSKIRELEKEIDKCREELTKYYIENESLIKEKNNLLKLREEYNINKAKLETQLESIRMNFYENYRIVLSNDFLNDIKFSNLKESELRNIIYSSRKAIEEVGQVNFLATTQYDETLKRFQFITKQKEDIISTKEKILEIIKTLDENLKEKFLDAFNKINENFKNIFYEVFKGGNASMILTKPDNLFETGIDIIIQPPGKNISNISLLSGGETAMASISLLFAFFLYCPSPFCIMDEVDAPFDENNVNLYKRLIKRFSSDTQFFIISHNKLTLEIADILYGITMEDYGITKVVSVKIEDIKDAV